MQPIGRGRIGSSRRRSENLPSTHPGEYDAGASNELLLRAYLAIVLSLTARSEAIAVTQIGQLRWGAGIEGMIAALQHTSST
jgi:hypothetical protein